MSLFFKILVTVTLLFLIAEDLYLNEQIDELLLKNQIKEKQITENIMLKCYNQGLSDAINLSKVTEIGNTIPITFVPNASLCSPIFIRGEK